MKTFLQSAIDYFNNPNEIGIHSSIITDHKQFDLLNEPDTDLSFLVYGERWSDISVDHGINILLFAAVIRGEI